MSVHRLTTGGCHVEPDWEIYLSLRGSAYLPLADLSGLWLSSSNYAWDKNLSWTLVLTVIRSVRFTN